jgi:hypothetical protein
MVTAASCHREHGREVGLGMCRERVWRSHSTPTQNGRKSNFILRSTTRIARYGGILARVSKMKGSRCQGIYKCCRHGWEAVPLSRSRCWPFAPLPYKFSDTSHRRHEDAPACVASIKVHVRTNWTRNLEMSHWIEWIRINYICVGHDSSVGVATRYGLDGAGIETRWRRDFPHPSRTALGPTQPPIQWVPGLSWG